MADVVHIPAGTHSVLGPSGAERWFSCPGSVRMSELVGDRGKTINESGELVDESSPAAREGTAAHHIFAQALIDNSDVFSFFGTEISVEGETIIVDGDMILQVSNAVEAARAMIDQHTIIYVEEKVKFHSDPRATGSVDLGLFNVKHRHLRSVDFKYGFVPVEAEGNKQTGCYLAGLRQKVEGVNPKQPKIDTFDSAIIQPRGQGDMVKVSATQGRDEFLRWEKEDLAKAVRATKAKKPKFVAGPHCHYCPHQTACSAFDKYVEPGIIADNAVNPEDMPVEKLVDIYTRSGLIKKFLWNVEKALEFKLRSGQIKEDSGVKLKRGKAPARVWRDDEPGLERAAIAEFGEANVYKKSFISPAQMEKLPKGKDFVSKNAVRPEGGLKLTLASDKAPGVTPPGAEVFDKVSGKS